MQPSVRSVAADLLLFAGAWLLRFGWMARWGRRHAQVDPEDLRSVRQVFDGHERLQLEAFLGQLPTPSPQAWPLPTAMHHLLGQVTSDPRGPLLLACTVGAVTPVLVAIAVRRRWGFGSGLLAGGLLALLPEHAAWSTSAVPVVHGLACLVGAFAVRRGWARALLAALAAGMRPELAVPALFLGAPGLAAVGVAGLQLALVGGPPGADLGAVLRVNVPLVIFLGPATLGLGLLAVRDRATLGLAGAAGTLHLVGACFSDYGYRHGLPAAVALLVLAASDPRRRWLAVVVGLGMAPSLVDLRGRWHQPDPAPPAVSTSPARGEGCVELSDEPPVPGQPLPSWVQWVAGSLDAPCVTWGLAPEHTEWSSRGLRDRAVRMSSTWTLEPVSTHHPGHGRPWRQVVRLTGGPEPWDRLGVAPETHGP